MTAARTTGAVAAAMRSRGRAGGTMTGGAGAARMCGGQGVMTGGARAARTGGGQGAMSRDAVGMLSIRTAGGSCRLRLPSQLTGVLKLSRALPAQGQECQAACGVVWQREEALA